MKVGEMFPSKYLSAGDLENREFELAIEAVNIEEIQADGATEKKAVVRFRGATKGLILNRTNAESIAAAYTDETQNWLGRLIVLFATTTLFRGNTVACLRVKIPQLPATQAAPQPPALQPPPAAAAPIDQAAPDADGDVIPF
jgi:hypothetical protein